MEDQQIGGNMMNGATAETGLRQAGKPERVLSRLFKRQWVNGELDTFMKNVKIRTKEAYNIDLDFDNADSFLAELVKYDLIKIMGKAVK